LAKAFKVHLSASGTVRVMTIRNDMQIELDELRTNNSRLNSTVQELRLEIAYYQGETKRLEWEKSLLKQDVGKMSALFKGWLNELQNSNARSVLDDSDYFANLVKNPSKNISDILQMNNAKLLVTTCQAPFYIEVMIVIFLRINVLYFRLFFDTQIL
jgi:predicted nuclease with TOPRIM domain